MNSRWNAHQEGPKWLKKLEFGYYPNELFVIAGPIRITTLPDLSEVVKMVSEEETVEDDWIYAPLEQIRTFDGDLIVRPYANRVFSLPKTHIIEHTGSDDRDHLIFHVWALSLFSGMRLTTTEAGFVDATPLKPHKLTDFLFPPRAFDKAIGFAEDFWNSNRHEPRRATLFEAAIHALFLAQRPQHMQFEEFMFLYTALDACYALASSIKSPVGRINHSDRISWMCNLFSIPIPSWADASASGKAELAILRNATLHEALFVNEPLGFALHGEGSGENITLQMKALICRILIALIGAHGSKYVRSSTDTRQYYLLDL